METGRRPSGEKFPSQRISARSVLVRAAPALCGRSMLCRTAETCASTPSPRTHTGWEGSASCRGRAVPAAAPYWGKTPEPRRLLPSPGEVPPPQIGAL